MWLLLGIAGLAVVLTGWLPAGQARDVLLDRGAPILGFLVAVTVLAELAERAGVFRAAATGCARLARGSTWRLFLLIAALGTAVTVALSLDTTAVLLTPVVLAVAEAARVRAWPFALLAVWLANTASLLLPGSNLTNLLALQREHLTTLRFAGRMAVPELVAVLLTVGYLALLFRRDLATRFEVPDRFEVQDRVLFGVCAVACASLAPAMIGGLAPWLAATVAALAALLAFVVRRPSVLRPALLPWRVVVLTLGLFLVVTAIADHGLAALLARWSGESPLRTVAVAAGASNVLNNLPTYLAMEPGIPPGHTTVLLAALLGTNGGPLLTAWGSLATLLWISRCRARGLDVSLRSFALIGLGGVPLVLLGTWGALLVTG